MSESKSAAKKAKGSAKSKERRQGRKGATTEAQLLEICKQLMLNEGYAAVSTRRVAKEAGMKGASVHYYFPTTDDLFLELFRREVSQQLQRLEQAASSQDYLLDIWDRYQYSEGTALHLEFMALANHREAVREEIALYTRRARKKRSAIYKQLLDLDAAKDSGLSGEGVAVLLIGVARTLIMERSLGISSGHRQAKKFVEYMLKRFSVDSSADK